MTTEYFIKEIENRFNAKKSTDIKHAKTVYKIEGNNKCYFYIKESCIDNPFWGFTDRIIAKLEETNYPYFLVLLSKENDYCFSSDTVQELCQKLSYVSTGKKKGEFKLTLPYLNDYENCKLDFDKLQTQIRNSTEIMDTKVSMIREFKEDILPDLITSEKLDIIKDKCQVVADIVNYLCKRHKEYSKTSQVFLETTIGAAIFYVYNLKTDNWYEGKVIVSKAALKDKEFCADHIVPRKYASSLLLEKALEKELTKDDIYNLLKDKFCKVVYLTKGENASFKTKEIKDLDNLFSFETLSKMYKEQKNIILTTITEDAFKQLKSKK